MIEIQKTAEPLETPIARAIVAERYRYILNELARLNGNTHRNLNIFRTLVAIMLTPAFYVAFFLRGNGVVLSASEKLLTGIFVIICLVGVFLSISIFADLMSWMDYRKEEQELLAAGNVNFRRAPYWGNLWRWHETYAIAVILILIAASWWLIFQYLLPILKAI